MPGKAVSSPTKSWQRRGVLVSDRFLRFPDGTWDELEGLPQPFRTAAQEAIFHLLEEPVPTLADPFPEADPLPGAYRLHLPSDGLTIWYTVTDSPDGQVVIVVQTSKPTREHGRV
jgi:hypothetical protein